MTKIPLIAGFSVWLFAVYGQIPFNNFDPYHAYYIPYTSTFTNQPIGHVNDGTAAQSGETGEFKNHPSIRDLFFQGAIFLRLKKLEATTASLASQLKAMQTALDAKTDITALNLKADITALNLKADQTAVDLKADKTTMQTALNNKADKTALAAKADITALDAKADKTTMQTALNNKADKTALAAKADITALDAKADKTDLAAKADITALAAKADITALDAKADKTTMQTALNNKADKTDLDTINIALNDITTPSSLGTIPTSCRDLKTVGFVKSGIFSIMDSKQVKNVYCDFTKTTDAELQKMIGTVDVKSTPTYFYAQMTMIYSTLNTILFDSIKLNEGTALNPATGIFVAPTPGKYYFAFSGMSDDGVPVRVVLQMKTGTTDWTLVGEGYGDTTFKTFSMHATLELVKGDQVRLYLLEGKIHEDVAHNYFNYVGWLVEENELTV